MYSWSWNVGCGCSGWGDAILTLDFALPSPSSSGVLLARFLPFALLDMGTSSSSIAQRPPPEGPASALLEHAPTYPSSSSIESMSIQGSQTSPLGVQLPLPDAPSTKSPRPALLPGRLRPPATLPVLLAALLPLRLPEALDARKDPLDRARDVARDRGIRLRVVVGAGRGASSPFMLSVTDWVCDRS